MGIRCAHCASFSSPGPFSRGHSVTEAERVTDLHERKNINSGSYSGQLPQRCYVYNFHGAVVEPLLYCTQVVVLLPSGGQCVRYLLRSGAE